MKICASLLTSYNFMQDVNQICHEHWDTTDSGLQAYMLYMLTSKRPPRQPCN